jgi:hemerythrin-like metal-binding protein
MACINRSDRYSVGNAHLGSRHQALVRIANALHEAILERRGRDYLGEPFEELEKYVEQHFSAEEAHISRINPTDLVRHQAHHRYFIDAIGNLCRKHRDGDDTVGMNVIDFLTHWLIDHILGLDRKYIRDSLERA